ncbi:MAG: bifunctional hydroxymethylpyrimidine kinase/phosphomethylpyrimidine kinase [Desulfovibrio sp.]|nr:bifunctional hydroxymethylpyrimidine kinase/phosphomethylpyrimidine kinase [Desulfovibrio sp.]
MQTPPNILTIAGSDSGGGAGIQADLKTVMALGGYGMSVITALTAQNGLGVTGIHAPEPEFVALQLRTVLEGFPVAAAKTGMLFSAPIIRAVAQELRNRSFPLVVDPVSVSQSGSRLLQEDAISALMEEMLPGCDLLTPNRPEAEMLTGLRISSTDDAAAAGEKLLNMGAKAVLIKGGHMESSVVVTDCLCLPGQPPKFLPQAKVETTNNHGTGCTLSAAIATGLGKGLPLQTAVAGAQEFLNLALRRSYAPGKGCGPVNHAAGLQFRSR